MHNFVSRQNWKGWRGWWCSDKSQCRMWRQTVRGSFSWRQLPFTSHFKCHKARSNKQNNDGELCLQQKIQLQNKKYDLSQANNAVNPIKIICIYFVLFSRVSTTLTTLSRNSAIRTIIWMQNECIRTRYRYMIGGRQPRGSNKSIAIPVSVRRAYTGMGYFIGKWHPLPKPEVSLLCQPPSTSALTHCKAVIFHIIAAIVQRRVISL